jgi:hypothetical protein
MTLRVRHLTATTVLVTAAVGWGLTASWTSAQDGSRPDRPDRPTRDRIEARVADHADRPDRGPMRGLAGARPVPPTDEEWREIEAFATEFAPNRLSKFNEMRKKDEPGWRVAQTVIAVRFRALDAMREHDPDLYDDRVAQLKLEDRIIGVADAAELGKGGELTPEAREALASDVRELVEMNLKEREARLDRLARQLDEQRKKLGEDRSAQGELVERKVKQIEADGSRALILGDAPGGKRLKDKPAAPDKR